MFQKILRSLVLLLTLSFGSWATADTVTLRDGLNGYNGTAENWIVGGSGANINRGADVNVGIRAVSDYGLYRFAIFAIEGGPVPNNATITSATLSLYKPHGPDAVMRAQRLTKPWTEMGSTWNSTGTVNWTTPGGDVVATPDGQGSVPDAAVNNCADGIGYEICWLHIDVTTGVQAFAAAAAGGTSQNHGWRVSQVSSSAEFNYKNFNSSDCCSTTWPQYRPKLTVTYTVPPVGGACNSGTLRPYDGAPVNGNPIPIAAGGATTFEAEHFNCGGQDVAYHDNVAGNNGGAFRATEDVDIIASTDSAGGGYVIQNYYTGEWLTYTVNVAQAGTYDFAIRASADNPGSFHLEVDGVNVTGSVPVPNTGSLNNYVWVTKTGVNLTAGQHVLKLVSDQQFFWVNQLRFTPSDGGGGDIAPDQSTAAGSLGASVPTFHSMSLYYSTAVPANCTTSNNSGCKVWMRYRKASEPNSAWREGYPLWFDPRTTGTGLPFTSGGTQYRARGSAVHLEPGTKYYFEFGTGTSFAGAAWQHHVAGTTWAESFPEGTVTAIPTQSSPFVIASNMGGTASAYRVYDGWNGSSRNVVDRGGQGTSAAQGTDASHAIVVRANFVIVRRVVARGAATAAIYVAPNVTDVVIEDVVAEDWAWRLGVCCTNDPEPNPNSWGTWGWNQAGGIHLGGNNARVVMQRNIIREPHFGAFPWDTDRACTSPTNHPIGPNGITVQSGGQQNVIRYNEITGHATNKNKWYMDGIGGEENFSTAGAPGADSDIYQNIIMHVFDDAIEAEGGGRNVRVWGNYTTDTRVAIATTTVHFGPTYVWRNVLNRLRVCHQSITNTDDDWFGQAFKYGGFNGGHGDGARYLFHNTLLQQQSGTHGEGAGRGIEPTSNGSGSVRWTTAQNNIFHVRSDTHSQAWSVETGDAPVGSLFTHNLFNGRYDTHLPAPDLDFEFSGAQVFYRPGHGASSVPALGGGGQGNYQLETGSKGQDTWSANNACVPLANFNDGFTGSAPDCGAHEQGAPPMKFGIDAGS
jgi:hypothetical protein